MEFNEERREFLKKLGRGAFRTGIFATTWGSSSYSLYQMSTLSFDDTDRSAVQKKTRGDNGILPGLIIDRKIKGVDFKLHGMQHCREYAERYYDRLEELVKGASVVVSEGGPKDIKDNSMWSTAESYFATIMGLCHKHGKQLYYFDPLSFLATSAEIYLGIYGLILANRGAKELVRSSKRRNLLKNAGKTLGGLYLSNSGFTTGLTNRALLAKGLGKKNCDDLLKGEVYLANHICDQRNVELTQRFKKFADLIGPEIKGKGYVLADYGRGHVIGVSQYLDHPILHGFKRILYGWNYGLIDSNACKKFEPEGNGWKESAIDLG